MSILQDHPETNTQPTQDGALSGLLQDIALLLHENREKILRLADMKGGWEGWLQAELADHISQTSSYARVEREQPVFAVPAQKIDIWCCHRSESYDPASGCFAERKVPRVGIELKCGGEWQDFLGTRKEFNLQSRFRKDIAKILAGMDDDATGESGARVYVMAVTLEESDTIGFEDVQVSTGTAVQKWTSAPFGNNGWYRLHLLWWYKDFPK